MAALTAHHKEELAEFVQQIEEEAAGKYGAKLTELTNQLNKHDVQKESEELQAQLDHLARQHDLEMAHLTEDLDAAQKEVQVLRQAATEREEEVGRLSGELCSLQEESSSSDVHVRRTEQTLKDYKQMVKELELQRSQVDEEKKAVEDQALELMGQMETLKEEKTSLEEKVQKLTELSEELQEKLSKSSGTHSPANQTTPHRGHSQSPVSSMDTPSKYITLAPEPHGQEFEYLRNVLYQYMTGKGNKHMAKALAAIVRFSPEQTQKVLQKYP
jgi:chromosome segregation ATPase